MGLDLGTVEARSRHVGLGRASSEPERAREGKDEVHTRAQWALGTPAGSTGKLGMGSLIGELEGASALDGGLGQSWGYGCLNWSGLASTIRPEGEPRR